MLKNTRMKPILIGCLLGVIVACFGVVAMLKIKASINDTENFLSYRLIEEAGYEGSSSLLDRLSDEKLSKEVLRAMKGSHLLLHFSKSEEEMESFTYFEQKLSGDDFMIARAGNGLFVMALNEESLNRGIYYLVYRLVDDKGRLLIKQDETYLGRGDNVRALSFEGNVALKDMPIVATQKDAMAASRELAFYINEVTGASLSVYDKEVEGPSIRLCIDEALEESVSYTEGDVIFIKGKDKESLLSEVYSFSNSYLGIMFAGTDRERINEKARETAISVKGNSLNSWISEREPIITLWNVNSPRGIYLNNNTSLKTDVMSYSDEQLYEYVRMMKNLGFTGIQVTDMCSAWAGAGGYEFVHERIRFMADAAHSMGMKFTLWVWGAEFTGYGWSDASVTYSKEDYDYARENPKVLACFDKYYSIYAKLSDVCDRVIAHYYDPGNLTEASDVAFFGSMLRDKFKAVNPSIDFGVSCWVDAFDKNEFISYLGNDITIYETNWHDDESEYDSFRNFAVNNAVRLGTWAWNTGEMEIDQLAQMNFQPHIIKETYDLSREHESVVSPMYWSEMDSNHIRNVFSLFCEGSLLSDPSIECDELTYRAAEAFFGPEYALEFSKVLTLIEDARSGHTRSQFVWSSKDYVLLSSDYDYMDIYLRASEALKLIDKMIEREVPLYSVPLPVSSVDFLRLIKSEVMEIREYSEFRGEFSKLNDIKFAGVSKETLETKLNSLSKPVNEYDSTIGLWGQVEARAQYRLLWDFAYENGLNFKEDPTFKANRKNVIVEYFESYQRGKDYPVLQAFPYFQYGVAFGEKETEMYVEELILEGRLSRDESTGKVYLSNWENVSGFFN